MGEGPASTRREACPRSVEAMDKMPLPKKLGGPPRLLGTLAHCIDWSACGFSRRRPGSQHQASRNRIRNAGSRFRRLFDRIQF